MRYPLRSYLPSITQALQTKTFQNFQFGFQPGLDYGHALPAFVLAMIEAEKNGESIALAVHDVRWDFNSRFHEQIILYMSIAGVDPCIN